MRKTRKELRNKRQGINYKASSGLPSPHISQKDRWVIVNEKGNPLVFLSEKKAVETAIGMVKVHGKNVEVDHQVRNEKDEWLSVE